MHTTDALRHALLLSFEWNRTLADDLRDAPLAFPTANGGNHATWIIGHACVAHAGLRSMVTGEPNPLAPWEAIFGGGSTPTADASNYPSFDELLRTWRSEHEKTLAVLAAQDDASLDAKPKAVPPALADFPDFATVGRILLFIAMHEMSHRGQLADIRRSLGRGVLAF